MADLNDIERAHDHLERCWRPIMDATLLLTGLARSMPALEPECQVLRLALSHLTAMNKLLAGLGDDLRRRIEELEAHPAGDIGEDPETGGQT